MSRRQTYELPGVNHGATPIPMAARVGSSFQTSAIAGKDPATNSVPEDSVAQVSFAFSNARTLCEIAGVDLDQIVYMEVLLADNALREEVNKHWTSWYPDDHDRPARHTTVRELPGKMMVQLRIQAQLD